MRSRIAMGAALLLLGACRIQNPDHCQHKASNADAWCAEEHSERPHCSPCEADNNGCVAEAPSLELCPLLEVTGSTGSSTSSTSSSTSSNTG